MSPEQGNDKSSLEQAKSSIDYEAMLEEAQADAEASHSAPDVDNLPISPEQRERTAETFAILSAALGQMERTAEEIEAISPNENIFRGDLKAQMDEVRDRIYRMPESPASRLALDYYQQAQQRFDALIQHDRRRENQHGEHVQQRVRAARTAVEQFAHQELNRQSISAVMHAVRGEFDGLMRAATGDQDERWSIYVRLTQVFDELTIELRGLQYRLGDEDLRVVVGAAEAGSMIGHDRRPGLRNTAEQVTNNVGESSRRLTMHLERLADIHKL